MWTRAIWFGFVFRNFVKPLFGRTMNELELDATVVKIRLRMPFRNLRINQSGASKCLCDLSLICLLSRRLFWVGMDWVYKRVASGVYGIARKAPVSNLKLQIQTAATWSRREINPHNFGRCAWILSKEA